MMPTMIVGLGTIATVVESFASEIYLAKKVSGDSSLNHNYHGVPSR